MRWNTNCLLLRVMLIIVSIGCGSLAGCVIISVGLQLQLPSLGITCLGGVNLLPTDPVYPLPLFLPMGFSWAPFLAQTANKHQMGLSVDMDAAYLTDRGDAWVIDSTGSRLAHYVYIDNLGLLGIDPNEVCKNLDSATQHFNKIGLAIHEVQKASSTGETLGICIDGGRRLVRNTWERFSYLYAALSGLLEVSVVGWWR